MQATSHSPVLRLERLRLFPGVTPPLAPSPSKWTRLLPASRSDPSAFGPGDIRFRLAAGSAVVSISGAPFGAEGVLSAAKDSFRLPGVCGGRHVAGAETSIESAKQSFDLADAMPPVVELDRLDMPLLEAETNVEEPFFLLPSIDCILLVSFTIASGSLDAP